MHRRVVLLLANAAFAVGLGACAGGMTDDQAARWLVAPDRYETYNCDWVAATLKEKHTRAGELEALMAQAESGSGGALVSSVAYRPEYLQVIGERDDLQKAYAEKKCEQPAESAAGATASPESVPAPNSPNQPFSRAGSPN